MARALGTLGRGDPYGGGKADQSVRGIMRDALAAVRLVSPINLVLVLGVSETNMAQQSFRATAPNLVVAWLHVPLGIMAILAFCFAIHVGLAATAVQFPASVACLILLFLALLLSQVVLGAHKTRMIVNLIDVPVSPSVIPSMVYFLISHCLLLSGWLGSALDQHPLHPILHSPPSQSTDRHLGGRQDHSRV